MNLRWGKWAILAACLTAGVFFPSRVSGATPTFNAVGTSGKAGSGSCTPGVPAGTQANDILVLVSTSWDNVDHSVTGYTGKLQATGTVGADNLRYEVHWKRAGASEVSPTVSHTAGGDIFCVIAGYRGAVTSGDPFDVVGTPESNADSESPISTAQVTTTVANTRVLHIIAEANGTDFNTLGGICTNDRFSDYNTPNDTLGILIADGEKTAAGATGACTANDSGPFTYHSVSTLLALKEQVDTPPGAPGTPTFTNVEFTSVRVNWTAASGANSYKVERAPDSGGSPGSFVQIASGVTVLFLNDSGLTSGTKYWYKVRGTNGAGDGSYSGNGTVTTSSESFTPGFQRYSCWAPDGNCFAVRSNGARIDFGSGLLDYATSDGTTVTFAGPISAPNLGSAGYHLHSRTFTSATVNANTCGEVEVTQFPDVLANEECLVVNGATDPAYVTTCYFSAANTVKVRYCSLHSSAGEGAGSSLLHDFVWFTDGGKRATQSIDFTAFAVNECKDTNITVSGAVDAMPVVVGAPAAVPANLTWTAWVSAADTVTLRVCDPTSSTVADPAAMTWAVRVLDRPNAWGHFQKHQNDFGSLAAGADQNFTMTARGALTQQVCLAVVPHAAASLGELYYRCWHNATDTARVKQHNIGSSARDAPLADYGVLMFR